MEQRAKTSPQRLAMASVAGAGLMLLGGIVLCLPWDRYLRVWGHGFRAMISPGGGMVMIVLLLLVGGGLVSWRAESRLGTGLRMEWWDEREVDTLRRKVERPQWSAVFWVMMLLWVAALIFAPRHSPIRMFGYILTLPAQVVERLRKVLRPPRLAVPGGLRWGEFKPIHSDHWGER